MLHISVADPHHVDADPDPACHFDVDPNPCIFDADPDPACHFDADLDSIFHFDPESHPEPSFQLKPQNLEKVLKSARIPYILACHLQIDADPNPANHFDLEPVPAYLVDPDPDPTFQFDADPSGFGSTKLLHIQKTPMLTPPFLLLTSNHQLMT